VFDALSDRLEGIFTGLRNRGRLSDATSTTVTREIRRALLEADVNVRVARSFHRAGEGECDRSGSLEEPSPGSSSSRIVPRRARGNARRGQTGKLTMSPKPPTSSCSPACRAPERRPPPASFARLLKSQGLQPVARRRRPATAAAVSSLRVLAGRVEVSVFSDPRIRSTARGGHRRSRALGRNV
jgi:signal recognition particle subunit SRP54